MNTVTGKLTITKDQYNRDIYSVEYKDEKGQTTTVPIKKEDRIKIPRNKRKNGMPALITLQDNTVVKIEEAGAAPERAQPQQGARVQERLLRQAARPAANNIQNRQRADDREPPLQDATAPYNFIPYDPKKVLTGFEPSSDNLYSGTITCTLKALTPLLVASSEQGEDNGIKTRSFFEVNGKKTIPGSTLKGMSRSLIQILSFSKPLPVNDRKIFWRDVRNQKYTNKFVTPRPQVKPKYKAGFLYQTGAHHYICPCDMARIEQKDLESYTSSAGILDDRDIYMQSYEKKTAAWDKKHKSRRLQFDCYPFSHDKRDSRTGEVKFSLLYDKVDKNTMGSPSASKLGWLVFTGFMAGKHMDFIFHNENKKQISVDHIYGDFEAQLTRHQRDLDSVKGVLYDCIGKYGSDKRQPVFYLEENGEVVFFGLAALFRLQCTEDVMSLLRLDPQNHSYDFTECLFGTIRFDPQKGRISFSHAQCTADKAVIALDPTVLGQPSATCVPHYIEQPDTAQARQNTRGEYTNAGLHDFNMSVARLRLPKVYWHRDVEVVPPPKNEDGEENKTIQVKLKPLNNKDSKFEFKIYLDGISEEELGAILMAIELPDGQAHKLGMGKSLGLGSVQINIKDGGFKLYKTRDKYDRLSTRMHGDVKYTVPDKKICTQTFMRMILRKLGQPVAENIDPTEAYGALEPIRHLRAIIDYKNKPENKATRMMPLERRDRRSRDTCSSYQEKAILPDAIAVKKGVACDQRRGH